MKRSSSELSNEHTNAKLIVLEEEQNQLSVYNAAAAAAEGNVVASTSGVNNANDDDDSDSVEHPDGNLMMYMFNAPTLIRNVTWMDKFRYNLNKKNQTVLNYNSSVFEIMGFLRQSLSIDDNIEDFLPSVSDQIVINKPKSPRVVYQVGKLLKGGMSQYYFFDYVRVKRAEGNFGQYLSMTWPNQYLHNDAIANVIIKYKKWDVNSMKLQDITYINIPNNTTVAGKMAFARKFFDIRQQCNKSNFMSGELKKKVVCEQFSVERFDEVFAFEGETKTSADVRLLAGVIIEGFKQSKEETDYETVNCKTIQEKTYSLSVRPMVFFKIENPS
ncbi:DBP-2 [Alphabaculovirus myunipunctae]|uniref:DBP-2 n=1 Tax=Mythimna unipuncta nucleopolyhedrovirus TaxID=447897 RepID=A0A2K9VSF0_9ABAC|nr:DBP-2 [Mythimna unipuncta nucleopolyhedrovirus]AUV65401.1 DBP-2 [Mythimna unipuncta nucleopolyhedrovirus]